MKALVALISAIALLGSSLACGQDHTEAAARGDLDRVVPRLPSGLSIAEVEERLGEPQVQFEVEGSETVLTYGLWQVVFRPNLYMRIRRYFAGYRHADRQPVASLDRKVRALKLGSSRGTVERILGKAETWQVLTFGEDERLWYGRGRWKLYFSDQRLSGKALYK